MLSSILVIGVVSALVLGFLLAMLFFNIDFNMGEKTSNNNTNDNVLTLNTTDKMINQIVINIVDNNNINVSSTK